MLSPVQVSMTLCPVARQAPLSMGFSRQEHWSGVPVPFSRGSSQPRGPAQVSSTTGRFFTIWAIREGLKEPMPSWYVRLLFYSGTVFSTCWFTPNPLPETEWDGLEEFHTLIDLSTPLPLTVEQKVGFNPQWLVRSLGSGCWRFGVRSCFSHPSRWPDTCLPPHLSGGAQDSTWLTGKLWPEWFRPQEAL